MAEAVVDERPPRFYCHMCSMEVNIPNTTDFTCPHCSGGFIEELPAVPSTTSASSSTSSLSDGPGNSSNSDAPGLNRLVDMDAIRGEIETLLMSRNGPIEIAIGPANRRGGILVGGGGSGANSGNSSATAGGTGGPSGGRVHPPNLGSLDTVLMDFLQSISGAGGEDGGYFGNAPMFFMGNPGDYAWGREGIDTIVTQLLNQMETSGPPPLPKDKIDEIPKVNVTSEDVERKTQCSVCWEDFRKDEIVRRLPCSHIYHENCIVPWLDLHGTCPICRKSLSLDDDMHDANMGSGGVVVMDTGMIDATQQGDADMEGVDTNSGNRANQSTQANSGNNSSPRQRQNQQQQQQQQSNVFGFDDSAVDLD